MNETRKPNGEQGFTLIEVCALMVISVFLLYALHTSLQASIKSRSLADRTHRVSALASEYLSRLRAIPFGQGGDVDATALQMTELWDDDQDMGNTTLHAITVPADEQGFTFTTATNDGMNGTWRIKVSDDLDGNGLVDEDRDGRNDILRVEIFFNDVLQRQTLIATEPAFTKEDIGKKYI